MMKLLKGLLQPAQFHLHPSYWARSRPLQTQIDNDNESTNRRLLMHCQLIVKLLMIMMMIHMLVARSIQMTLRQGLRIVLLH